MIEIEPIGWWNTGFPLAVLGFLAVGLPKVLVPFDTRSQGEVAAAIWAAAGLLLMAGALLFAAIYGVRGAEVGDAFYEAPAAVTLFFLRLSGFAAIVWAPILALVWFGQAQGVEKRKGEDVAKDG